eukprot:1141396-Pelagomonas_calceolata.AAC.4
MSPQHGTEFLMYVEPHDPNQACKSFQDRKQEPLHNSCKLQYCQDCTQLQDGLLLAHLIRPKSVAKTARSSKMARVWPTQLRGPWLNGMKACSRAGLAPEKFEGKGMLARMSWLPLML